MDPSPPPLLSKPQYKNKGNIATWLSALILTIISSGLLITILMIVFGTAAGAGMKESWRITFFLAGSLGAISATAAIYLAMKTQSSVIKIIVIPVAGLASIPHFIVFAIGLIAAGIIIFTPEEKKVTPLHKAVMRSNIKKAKEILLTKPNIEATTSLGRTALAIAVRNKDPLMVKLLLDHGANANISLYAKCGNNCDLRGPLILHGIDVNSPQVVSFLLNHGASIKAHRDWIGGGVIQTALDRRKIIQQQTGLSPNERRKELNNNTHIINQLINAGHPKVPHTECNIDSKNANYFKTNPNLIHDKDIIQIICEKPPNPSWPAAPNQKNEASTE